MSAQAATAINGCDWPDAGRIRDRGVNLVVLPRTIPPWIASALDQLSDAALPALELEGSVDVVGPQAGLAITTAVAGDLGRWLASDVRMLLSGWAQTAVESRCLLHLEAVGGDACCKFHTDMTRIRLLCTYRGPGSEWVPDDQVQRRCLGHHGENADIVPDVSTVQRVPRFAIALLKGDAYDPRTPGIVHRSPPLPAGEAARLLLRIDGRR
jgi:hypothetical protein